MSVPYTCPECKRVFNWGDDADSAEVDREGERWVSCRKNAFWKLTFHLRNEHPSGGFECPRRAENAISWPGKDHWLVIDGHKACSYCGSMDPDELFTAIDAGAKITPTDKNYKIYVDLPKAHAKFYFQHLSHEQQHRLLDLSNTGKINMGEWDFYVTPFFIRRKQKPAAE
jgi:hypothetical protein